MTASKDFADYCCDLLASAGPCVAKRMFGGFSISIDALTLAVLADLGDGEKLWLKGDNATRSRYETAGCVIFTYYPKQGAPRTMNYYSAPEEAMDSPDAMRPWAALALECALRARAAKPVTKSVTKARTQSAGTKRPVAKVELAQIATKTVAKRAAPAKAVHAAAPTVKAARPPAKRAVAPAPKQRAARKSTQA